MQRYIATSMLCLATAACAPPPAAPPASAGVVQTTAATPATTPAPADAVSTPVPPQSESGTVTARRAAPARVAHVATTAPVAPRMVDAPRPLGVPGAVPPLTGTLRTDTPAVAAAPDVREVLVPAGTTLNVTVTTALASNTSHVDDRIAGTLANALVIDGVTAVPAGASVTGYVSDAEPSGRVSGLARLGLRFTSLAVGTGTVHVDTGTVMREAAPTKKADAGKIGLGAGAGALIGAIVHGRRGAVEGGAIGAAAGTAMVLATRGDDVTVDVGSVVTTTLTSPVTIHVSRPGL